MEIRRSVIRAFAAVGALLLLACGGDEGTGPGPPPPNSWVKKAALPGGPLAGAVSFVVRDKLYVGTGFRNGWTNVFYEYDLTLNSWRQVASFPGGVRSNAIAFAIGDYGFIGLGYNCLGAGICTFHYFKDLWMYVPQSDVWVGMGDFPGNARAYAAAFVIGENAYVAGGSTAGNNDVWEYKFAQNSWTRKADYPGLCHARGTAFSVLGKGYVGLGYTNGECRDFWQYDPSANSWTEIAIFPGPAKYDALGFSFADVPFVVGGARELDNQSDVWNYNPASNSWLQLATTYPGKGRSQMIAGIVAGRILLGLGTTSETGGLAAAADDMWEYIPPR